MTARCPAGHDSDEVDYCSVCGAAMSAAPTVGKGPAAVAPSGSGASAGACPSCGEVRGIADARFCEVCRYDFVARAPGPPPGAVAKAAPPVPTRTPVVATPAAQAAPAAHAKEQWELVLTIDPTLDDEPDPACVPPTDPERIFPIETAEMLVGRRDDQHNIRPSVPLNDPGASRRHAKFLLDRDGGVSLQDLASMNGTKLNGKDVVSGSIRRLESGDEVTFGRWSRIKLRARV